MRISRFIFICLLSLMLGACSWSNFPFLYKPDIQQGNVLDQDRVSQLKLGMNRDEVTYLMGNPVLETVLDSNDTQYVYTFKPGKGTMKEQKIILTFANDKLVKIDNQ